jgi:hypothetical protein
MNAIPILDTAVVSEEIRYIRLQKFADAASRKILTRNAFANPESTNRTSQTATTKADILNLISSDTTAVSNIWKLHQQISAAVYCGNTLVQKE